MTLASQWQQLEGRLDESWDVIDLRLIVADEPLLDRAASLLGPLAPGRAGSALRFSMGRGTSPGPGTVRRLLARLDAEGIAGTLELVSVATDAARAAPTAPTRETLIASWTRLVDELPYDWSDLLCHLHLTSSDDLPRAALLTAPLNPSREHGEPPGFRFRVARSFGYGTSLQMTERCLRRLDEEEIRGEVSVLRVLSDTRPVATQGPVWYLGGKAV